MITDGVEREDWIPLPNFPNYQISNMGRIQNGKNKILKFVITKGYYKTNLSHNGVAKTIRIHRLVAETFIPNFDNKPIVDHINRNQLDNRVSNLRWATLSENGVNSKVWSNNTSGVKGVSFDKSRNRYLTTIQFGREKKFIGYFKTIEEASLKREEFEVKLFGEFKPCV